jgi:lysophospholipase L1-like esterase
MQKYLLALATLCFICMGASSQTKPVISVIGSSTAVGTGATPIDSSWVNLTKYYLEGLHEIDTIYNRAAGGTITADGASNKPDTGIVWVMANDKPDLVIVSYASNDAAADIPLDSTMAHLRFIYQTVTNAGKICWVTTPHPRDGLNGNQNAAQLAAVDSTFAQFPSYSLDFWTPLVASDGVSLAEQYNSGDGVHVNNAGHQVLFQVVKNADIMGPFFPLALTLARFSAVAEQQDVLVQWTSASAGPATFVIQRSQDGTVFADLGEVDAQDNASGVSYNWKDQRPLPGTSYYRLKSTNDGAVTYSIVAVVMRPAAGLALGNLYIQQGGSQLIVTIQIANSQNVAFSIIDAAGALVQRQVAFTAAPSSTVSLSVSGLAAGIYYLRMTTSDGGISIKPFLKP